MRDPGFHLTLLSLICVCDLKRSEFFIRPAYKSGFLCIFAAQTRRMMERKDFYKTEYKEEEMQELFEWFEKHKEQLPKTLQIDDATSTSDLPRTVNSFIRLLKGLKLTPSNAGYVAHLMLIRQRLREEGIGE